MSKEISETVIINIPMLPPSECSPNFRGHWAKKAKAVKVLREAAMMCALNDSNFARPKYDKAEVSITLVVRDARYYRDPDNMVASLKSAIDGCVDAGIIKDDSEKHLRYRLPIMYEINKEKTPLTILNFKGQR